MKAEIFDQQIRRLRVHFGDRAYSPELVRLIAMEVSKMSEKALVTFVDVAIGTRPVSKPPNVLDFRDALIQDSNNQLKRDVAAVTQVVKRSRAGMLTHLREVLGRDFKSLGDLISQPNRKPKF